MLLITDQSNQTAVASEFLAVEAIPFNKVEIQPRVLALLQKPAFLFFLADEASKRAKPCGNDKQNEFSKRHWAGNGRASYCAMPPDIGLARETGNPYYRSFEEANGAVTTTPAWYGSVAVAHLVYEALTMGATTKGEAWDAIKAKPAVVAFGETKARQTLRSVFEELAIFGLVKTRTDKSVVMVPPFEVETTQDVREGKRAAVEALPPPPDVIVVDAEFTEVVDEVADVFAEGQLALPAPAATEPKKGRGKGRKPAATEATA